MDNPKKANQGKYNRSKKKKEHYKGNGSKGVGGYKDKEIENLKNNGKLKQQPDHIKGSSDISATSTIIHKPCDGNLTESSAKINTANLKHETEEIENLTRKYSRRHIISTWTRDFKLPEYKDSDDETGEDFEKLISGSSTYFVGRHFMLKEEQDWLVKSESCDSAFSLDLKRLETGISSIPFYKRHGLPVKSFSPKEILLMINEAESNEKNYRVIKNVAEDAQKVTLNNSNKKDNSILILDDFKDEIILIKDSDNLSNDNEIEYSSPLLPKSSDCLGSNIQYNLNNEQSYRINSWEHKPSENYLSGINNISEVDEYKNINVESNKPLNSMSNNSQHTILEPRQKRTVCTTGTYNKTYCISPENCEGPVTDNNLQEYSFINLKSHKIIADHNDDVDNKSDKTEFNLLNPIEARCQNNENKTPIFVPSSQSDIFNHKDGNLIVKDVCASAESLCGGETSRSETPKFTLNKSLPNYLKNECEIAKFSINDSSSSNKFDSTGGNCLDFVNTGSSVECLSVCKSIKTETVQQERNHLKSADSRKLKLDYDTVALNVDKDNDNDDDLDFLLGLEKSTKNTSKDISSSGVTSNLSILQQKLKGSGVKKRPNENVSIKHTTENKRDSSVDNLPAEDLDEWLDSVLES